MQRPVKCMLGNGFEGIVIEAECQLSKGLPGIIIVGLGGKAVDEARQRISSAFASSHIPLPRKKIVVNLAPADIPKDSTSLDLAIAATILEAAEQTVKLIDDQTALIGELGLDGKVRPVRGIIGNILAGKKAGIKHFILPTSNLSQAMLVPGVLLSPVNTIEELYLDLTGRIALPNHISDSTKIVPTKKTHTSTTFSEIAGQEHAKRALEIAAAGGHNILLIGPPGTGKTMLASAMISLLPPLTRKEMLEVTHLHSLSGLHYDQLVIDRPFRSPHHSASHIAILGGGKQLRPGEISLSHGGVLFFDEFPEFNRQTIEALRQPLEQRKITIARAKETAEYPAKFIFIATANPCPCGYYGNDDKCTCSVSQIQHYGRKMSGPILDRIDLYVNVQVVDHSQLLGVDNNDNDNAIKRRVDRARSTQQKRYGSGGRLNSDATNRELVELGAIDSSAITLLNTAANQLDLSARSYIRTLRVARTIADLESSPRICAQHVGEALQYRHQNNQLA